MPRRRAGFTLLELLTVMAIMGLLFSILLPSLSAARRTAKANVCLSHLKGVGTTFALYLNENEDKFPPYRIDRDSPTSEELYINSFGCAAPRWQWFLETEHGPVVDPKPFGNAIQRVGFFHDETHARFGGAPMEMSNEVFTCPSLSDPDVALNIRDGAFGYNYQYLGNTRKDRSESRWDNFPVSQHQIRNPTDTVMVADSRGVGPRHGVHSYTLDPPRMAIERGAKRFGPEPGQNAELMPDYPVLTGIDVTLYAYSPVEARHNNRGNVLFVDTHAKAMSLVELGYQFSPGGMDSTDQRIPKNTPMPIRDPEGETYTASNTLWNGQGVDELAREHRPEAP